MIGFSFAVEVEGSKKLCSRVIPPLKMPFHGWRHLSCIDLCEMAPHHLCDATISSSEVQEPLGLPVWVDAEQLLELVRRKHEHRSPTEKPETEESQGTDRLHAKYRLASGTHPLIEVRDTRGLRTDDTKE